MSIRKNVGGGRGRSVEGKEKEKCITGALSGVRN
jgi:hypothetical protein